MTTQPTEEQYIVARKAAWVSVLNTCLTALGVSTTTSNAKWVVERAEIIAALREVCEDFGDNEWGDDLHLADVITKHLARHLDSKGGP